MPRAYLPRALVVATLLVAYVIFEWVSFIHEYKGLPITPWNPGLGLVFALMVIGGARYGIVLFAGVVVAEIILLQSNLKWPIILGISAIIAAGYSTIAVVLRKTLRLDVGLHHLRDVLILLAGGISGAALVALLLCLFLLANAQLNLADIVVAAGLLFIGDAIGIGVITPLALRLALRGRKSSFRSLRAMLPDVALCVAVVVLSLWAIVGSEKVDDFKFFYVLFLPVVAIALRNGLDGACIGLTVTQLALVGLLHRYGYDARAFAEFQMLMLVLTMTGLIVGVVVMERQNAEGAVREIEALLRTKEAEAAHATRTNLVSGMAAAIAHEINQPMTAARALARSAQHILRSPGADLARADSNLTTMIAQIDHAAGVVRRMRDFLRRGRPHVSTIDIRSMLEDTLMLMRLEASTNQVRIELVASAALPPVDGDRTQLQQVVLNLVRNAIEAIAEARQVDGRIRVAASRLDAPARVEISVSDNGPGVDSGLADRLFDPLTTSKQEGLGLGLAICASIVESHRGRIWLQSRDAGATEFRFSLPLEQSQAT